MHRISCIGVILLAACVDNGDTELGAGFEGLWRYRPGSFSFVNCYSDSRSVDLGGTGFAIESERGALVRVGTDGCRLSLMPAAATHAVGVAGETCTVQVTDPTSGAPITTRYQVRAWTFELAPGGGDELVEVFDVAAETTTGLGTVRCEVSGNNTLERP